MGQEIYSRSSFIFLIVIISVYMHVYDDELNQQLMTDRDYAFVMIYRTFVQTKWNNL